MIEEQAAESELAGSLSSAALAELLRSEIARGHYVIGSIMPSEADLRARFGVGRHTVREAVRRLAEAGLVDRRQGAGTRVIALHPRSTYVHSLQSLSELMHFTRETQLEVYDRGLIALDEEDAALVSTSPGSRWLRLRGVRRGVEQDDVICHSTILIHGRFSTLVTDVRRPIGPLYAAIEAGSGELVTEARQEISAGPLPADAARFLDLQTGLTGIKVTRRYLDMSGGIMLASRSWHDAGTFSYVISLRRDPAG